MKTIKANRKLSLNLETLQHLTGKELDNVIGGVAADNTTVIELTKDKNEPNCTFKAR
jgi:hypothetical protein